VTVNAATGGGTTTVASAAFVKVDVTTQGNWIGAYGAQGYTVIGDRQLVPTFGAATAWGKSDYIWTSSTSEPRALQKVGGNGRVAAVWSSPDVFNVDFDFNDSNSHRVAVYVMDWDNTGRRQRFEILDASNNAVLQTTDVADFAQGKYLVWDLKGKIRMRVTRLAGNNAIMEGLFFDAAPAAKRGALKVKGLNAQGVQLEISGDTGEMYNIQSSADMKSWTNVGQINLATSPTVYTDTTQNTQQGLRFYRVAP
jgi:hypothetical protein